jgi:hypothetical protein
METELSLQIAHALHRAAASKRLLPYQKFHSLCGKEIPLAQRYQALEAAISLLCGSAKVDYGALMSCDSGLPGPDFFQRFRKERLSEFVAIIGDPRFCRQSLKQKRVLVQLERERVYPHVDSLAALAQQAKQA